jgi:transcriptional regulator with XRE-family HTH domain
MRQKRGLTQRQLARELGISQNYVPAIEANDRQAGPNLQQMVKYFLRTFSDLLDVILIDPETKTEQVFEPRRGVPR